MEWTDEQTLNFIEMYRVRPQLWDSTHIYYKNKNRRHDSLTEIAVSFGIEKQEVEKKMKNLQSQFLRERKKELESKRTGSGAEEPYVSRWFAYQPIMFLADKNKPRRTVDNVDNSVHFVQNSQDEGGENGEQMQPEGLGEEQPSPSKEFQSPKAASSKSAKRKLSDIRSPSAPIIDEALNLMRSIQNKRADNTDEFSLYGEQIAIKIRRLSSPRTKFIVQNEINKILFDAEMGYYDQHNTPIRGVYDHLPQYPTSNMSMPLSMNHQMQAGYSNGAAPGMVPVNLNGLQCTF
ncbi:uncharacterized protein LOC123317941 [Coccinella septempunctata]|uniref:uncharacterized protein LOC123317941 n=1 Tax=Coccinella septempunctata TaxID=41139 RepID=UPI001D063352|nr:uncharacterized protein LOC123317941 [Coccinella septempunctata]